MLRNTAVYVIILLLCALQAGADIKENQLQQYKSAFRTKVISDNPGKEQEITRCLEGMIREGGAGVRLIDKFGLFLYDSSSNNLVLDRVKFIRDGSSSIFILFLKDGADSQTYSLYLEYVFSQSKGTYTLGEIYFSKLFGDRVDSVREFFGGD
ncbi:MAG TPA: hypothetical protein PK514_10665 [Spirochaetota bacterium]|nr:hypothetical protein [Spirochaetota bacterium]